ncbi:MAG: hypothetical protein JSU04_20370 [Bdellovibrionales bacterium]|nr:hypothetical protein [Bdellovibrionales bacterium]
MNKSLVYVFFYFSLVSLPFHALAQDEASFYPEETSDFSISTQSCKKASTNQLAIVNIGNTKAQTFYNECLKKTNSSKWCSQVLRPNPASIATFKCTYGDQQPHQLINPQDTTWKNAFYGVQLVQELSSLGINACQIYNWWRPEPYNANVGGAAGRHPYGTSIDVKFCTKLDMERAFAKLCDWRAQGRLRAVGYYGTTSLHLGIGDKTANTWGKSCPKSAIF